MDSRRRSLFFDFLAERKALGFGPWRWGCESLGKYIRKSASCPSSWGLERRGCCLLRRWFTVIDHEPWFGIRDMGPLYGEGSLVMSKGTARERGLRGGSFAKRKNRGAVVSRLDLPFRRRTRKGVRLRSRAAMTWPHSYPDVLPRAIQPPDPPNATGDGQTWAFRALSSSPK